MPEQDMHVLVFWIGSYPAGAPEHYASWTCGQARETSRHQCAMGPWTQKRSSGSADGGRGDHRDSMSHDILRDRIVIFVSIRYRVMLSALDEEGQKRKSDLSQ